MRIHFMRVANNNVTQSDFNFLTSVMLLCFFSNVMCPYTTTAHVLYMQLLLKRPCFDRQSVNMDLTHLFNHQGIKKMVKHNCKNVFLFQQNGVVYPLRCHHGYSSSCS